MKPPSAPSSKDKPTKRDIDKLGIFKEDGYLRGIEHYIPLDTLFWNEPAHKGKQIIGGAVSKSKKDGTVRGYFGPFIRTFEGEALSDPLKEYRKGEQTKKTKFYAGQFQLPNPGKRLLDFSGNHHGTFGGQVDAFSPLLKSKPSGVEVLIVATTKPLKPFQISPPKKGSGYGTGDVTMHKHPLPSQPDPELDRGRLYDLVDPDFPLWDYSKKYPNYINKNPFYTHPSTLPRRSHAHKPISGKLRLQMAKMAKMAVPVTFRPSEPGKKLGGCKDGCFTDFSKYGAIYMPPEKRMKSDRRGKLNPIMTGTMKSSTFRSIIQANVDKHVTSKTYKTMDSVMYVKAKKN